MQFMNIFKENLIFYMFVCSLPLDITAFIYCQVNIWELGSGFLFFFFVQFSFSLDARF